MSKILAVCGVLSGALLLAACGDGVNEKDLTAAVSQSLSKGGGALCLGMAHWPVDLTEAKQQVQQAKANSVFSRMRALEQVGLVQGTDVQIAGQVNGQPAQVTAKRYALTDAAKPFLKPATFTSQDTNGPVEETRDDLCWGTYALDKIDTWEKPKTVGEQTQTTVRYQYKIDGLADWAHRPEIQAAFPKIKTVLDGVGKKEQTVILQKTAAGWVAQH